MKLKILAFIMGVQVGLIGFLVHKLLTIYNTLWVTIPVIAFLCTVNFLGAAIAYYFQTSQIVTLGDLAVAKRGGILFNAPIMLFGMTGQYYIYFVYGDVESFIGMLTLTYFIFMFYSQEVEDTNKDE